MAPRSNWKGYLKLSLVSARVEMLPAVTGGERVRFSTLNAATGNPVQSRWVDAVTGDAVEDDDQVRGYERGEGDVVILEDDDLDSIALESVRTIAIESFAAQDSIGWIWRDTPYFLLPSDAVSTEAYAVIRDAMAATGTVGIARLVMGGRERAVMLVPKARGIVLWSLRFGEEVRDPDEVFPDTLPEAGKAETALLRKLVEAGTVAWEPKMVTDPTQDAVLELVAAKRKAQAKNPAAKTAAPAPEGKVINIVDALKRSLAAEKGKR